MYVRMLPFIILCHLLLFFVCGFVAECMVSVLDTSAEGPGLKSQPRRCRVTCSLMQTVHRASVHQAAKLVAALLS